MFDTTPHHRFPNLNQAKNTQLHGFSVWFFNPEEFHRLKAEIFTQHCYYFEADTPQPTIIDAGAHLGLTTLYFKKLYPNARITAFEPNPSNATLFEKNIWENHLNDVTLHQTALSDTAGEGLALFVDANDTQPWHSTSSFARHAWNGQQLSTQAIPVTTTTLAPFLTKPITLLKMDIEGMETAVLQSAQAQLVNVEQLIVEFHPTTNQSLTQLLAVLEPVFTITLTPPPKKSRPGQLIMIHGKRRD